MDKRGIIKLGIFGAVLLIVVFIIFLIFSSIFSSAELVKERYVLGEKVKIDLQGVVNYKVKIVTPSQTFIKQGSNDVVAFKANETGKHKIVLSYNGKTEEYSFEVVGNAVGQESVKALTENIEKTDNLSTASSVFSNGSNLPTGIINGLIHNVQKNARGTSYNLRVKVNQTSSNSKGLIISKKQSENVEVKRSIPAKWRIKDAGKIKVYWEEENKEIDFKAIDSNNDGYLDEVNWISGNLTSEQTFDIIIITKAEHLDNNRTFISDIYDSVKDLDGNWSESINDGEFVRVKFEKNLTKDNDITLFPRVVSGTPKIEVYEKDKDIKIAEFSNLKNNEYNKVLLTSLVGAQDSFDLRVLNGGVEFDYIVDPQIQIDNSPSPSIGITTLDNRTYVVAWVNGLNVGYFQVYDTNGTNLTTNISFDTTLSGLSRVAVSAINETNFIVSWIDVPSGFASYTIYNRDGTVSVSRVDAETTVGIVGANDIDLAPQNDRFQLCYVDDIEGDADVRFVIYGTWGAGTEPGIIPDGAITPEGTLQNLISCSAINDTRIAYGWFDDGSNSINYAILGNAGTSIFGINIIDTSVGETGQVAVSSLNNDRFALLWYDSAATNIQLAIMGIDNSTILASAVVDANAGTSSRVAATTIRNNSESMNSFLVAWNDRNADNIQAAVYNASGTLKTGPYTLVSDENTSSLLFDVYAGDTIRGTGLCNGTFILAYTNQSGLTFTKTFKIDGTEWNGICDFQAPNWSNALENPTDPATYSQGGFYQFNVSWTDNLAVQTVFIEHNFTGSFANYSISGNAGSVYFYNITNLAAGGYTWRMYANDTSNNVNQTDLFTYTINRKAPVLNLTLNGTANNITIEVGSTINLSAYKLEGDSGGQITLYREGNAINQGTGNISNLSTFNTIGIFNITVIYTQSQNYSQNALTYYVFVNDTTRPLWQNQNQSSNAVGQGNTNNLWANWTDNYALESVWLATNESGTWQNYTSRKAGLTINDFTDTSKIYIDPISATATINSINGGAVRDGINLSYNYDSGAADDTFDVVVNSSLINISQYQNISYYVKADSSNFHRTNLVVVNSSGSACAATTPVTLSSTSFTLITFNTVDITGCVKNEITQFRVRFSDDNDASTGTGNITLDELYLTSDLLRETIINFTWKNASISGGSVSWRIYMNDTSGNLNQTDIMTFNIQDLVFPTWSNSTETPADPTTYSSGQFYQFNVTWNDNVAIQTVRMQHNFTGTMANYSISGNNGAVYFYNYTSIPAGGYVWQIIANDTSNNINQTELFSYTVNRAASSVNLTLNGIDGNVTVQVGSNNVNLTGSRLAGEGNIKLFRNGTLINEGQPTIFNFSNFTTLGDYNITVIYEQTQNFTSSSRTNFLFVRDNLFPNNTLNSPVNGYNSSTRNIIFNATVREDFNLTNVSLWANFTGSFVINQTNSSGVNGDYLFNVTNIPDGGYIWAVQACDGSNNCNMSSNRTLTIDSVFPLIDYGTGTESSGTNFSRNWVYVNVSATELNEINISFRLYNNSGIYNETTYTNKGRTINWTNAPNGIYTYNVTITDVANNINTTATRRITLDTIAPNWSNAVEFPIDSPTYLSGQFYQFNVSWTDNLLGIQTVFIENNFTGSFANYSLTNISSVYSYNTTNLAAGGYVWRMYANDSLNNRNQTDLFTYMINRANSAVNLTLNGADGNVTVQVHTTVNLTGYRLAGEGDIKLYKNNVLINQGNGPLENLTSFNDTGTYNITVIYEQTQNFSQNSRTNYVIVQDTQFPTIVLNAPINSYNSSIKNVTFNVTANDNYNITNVSLWTNFTGTFTINQTNSSGFKGNYTFNVVNIPDGGFIWAGQVCDSSNNCNITANRTITIDTTPPNITAGATNVTNITLNGFVRVNCTVTDALIGLDTILIGAQKPTLPQQNYSTSLLGGNTRFSDIQVNEVGNWSFSCYANDTLNNLASFFIGNVSVTSAANAPSIPVLQFPVDGANLSSIPQFNWSNSTDPNGDAISYILEIDNNAAFTSPEYYNGSIVETNDPTEDTSVTLASDGQYFWHVRASDGGLNSSFSAARTFVLDRNPPAIALVFPGNNTNSTTPNVNFTWNVTDNLNFDIYCNLTLDGSANVSNILSQNGNNTNYTVLNLADGTHNWNVTCRDRANVNTSITRTFTIYTVNSPSVFNASLGSDNLSIILRWNNVTKATSYNIYISTNYSAGFSSTPNSTGITSLNFTDNNANTSLTRFYKVASVNGPAENITNVTVGKIQPPQMASGFNLMSWPLNLTNYVLNNGTNNGYNPPTKPLNCILSLFRYNGTKFQETTNDQGAWTPAIGDSDFITLESLKGYWFEANSSCNVTFLGEVPRANITTSLNFTFNVVSWNSAYQPRLGEEAALGNPLYVAPANSIDNIFRYNVSKGTANPQLTGFQGMHHFSGYGWWPFFGDEDFTNLEYGSGYYLDVPASQTNWTHNPNFNN